MNKWLVIGLVAMLAAVGCGSGEQTTQPADDTAAAPAPGDTAAPAAPAAPEAQPEAKKLTIGVMPKLKGIEYFKACQRGAEEAGKELGVTLDYDGPVNNDVAMQSRMVDTWAAKRYDAIAVAPNDPAAIVPALEKARKRGTKTITWDADAKASSRDFFINQATSEGIAQTLMDVMAQNVGEDAKYIIITGSLTAANQNIWMDLMEKYRQERYPNMVNLSPEGPKASEEDQALAQQTASDVLKSYPDVQGIFAITSVALPGAAEAIRQAGAADKVFLTGLATPNAMKQYVKDGTCKKIVLWNPVDLGYLTVQASVAAAQGKLKAGDTTFTAGRLGELKVEGDQIILGPPIVFDKDNIDQFDF